MFVVTIEPDLCGRVIKRHAVVVAVGTGDGDTDAVAPAEQLGGRVEVKDKFDRLAGHGLGIGLEAAVPGEIEIVPGWRG